MATPLLLVAIFSVCTFGERRDTWSTVPQLMKLTHVGQSCPSIVICTHSLSLPVSLIKSLQKKQNQKKNPQPLTHTELREF